MIAAWEDPVGDSPFGYNNGYLSFIEIGEDSGYLTFNCEYISTFLWMQSYQKVLGKYLPFEEVKAPLKKAAKKGMKAL